MTDLVFNVKNIFQNSDQNGCLVQYGANKYLIPAYQRGYKWASDANGAATRLLSDLWTAFDRPSSKEYYLQYITVKLNKDDCFLEVIDGQQRLTTLSILISYLTMSCDRENIAAHRLEYSSRPNFFEDHIYDPEALSALLEQKWNNETGLNLGGDFNTQDVYYLFSAAEMFKIFFDGINRSNDFLNFLLEKVKIIVNVVEQHIPGEKVFSNLNNKILLTESELIKGLFITRLGRTSAGTRKKSFREIELQRSQIGRDWDRIANWTAREDVCTFYFDGTDGLRGLLILVATSLETGTNKLRLDANERDNPLFEFFNKIDDLNKAYDNFRTFSAKLQDWFTDKKHHDLLGYVRFAPNSKYKTRIFLRACLGIRTKNSLIKMLTAKAQELIPKDTDNLFYGSKESNIGIQRLLLALSVFSEEQNARFDFTTYFNAKWSLEHIFPQSPEGKGQIFTDEEKLEVRNMLAPIMSQEIDELLNLPERDDSQKDVIYAALAELKILHSIGNMCLLTKDDNSKLGCGLFKAKRKLIFDLTKAGEFVPKHTFEVFSKMVISDDPGNLLLWSKSNIESHAIWIRERLTNLHQQIDL